MKFSPAEKGSFSVTSSRAAVSPASPIKFDGTAFEAEVVSSLSNQDFISYANAVFDKIRALCMMDDDYYLYLTACGFIEKDASRRISVSKPKSKKIYWAIYIIATLGAVICVADRSPFSIFFFALMAFGLIGAFSKDRTSISKQDLRKLSEIVSASHQLADDMGGTVKFTDSGNMTTSKPPKGSFAKLFSNASENSFSNTVPTSTPQNYERFHVAGVSFHQNEIASLGYENSDYEMSKKEIIDSSMENEKIYAVEFDPQRVELEPEPDNPHDPNAIKVIVDGVHVGYIKKGSTAHVRNLLAAGGKVSAEIYGGKYKMLCHYDEDDDDVYEMECDEDMYGVTVSISK